MPQNSSKSDPGIICMRFLNDSLLQLQNKNILTFLPLHHGFLSWHCRFYRRGLTPQTSDITLTEQFWELKARILISVSHIRIADFILISTLSSEFRGKSQDSNHIWNFSVALAKNFGIHYLAGGRPSYVLKFSKGFYSIQTTYYFIVKLLK